MKTLLAVTKKNSLKVVLVLTGIMFLFSCGTQKAVVNDAGGAVPQNTVSLLVGAAKGGLVENKDMLELDNVAAVDAITGATKTTFNAGIHSTLNIKGHQVETGLDYINFNQSVGYALPSFAVAGDRDFSFQQLRLPVTYNFQFLKNAQEEPRFIIKAGFSAGFTIAKSIAENGNLPDYDFKALDYGPTFGMAFYPYQFSSQYRTGLYFDLYRGTKIYDDVYHQAHGMGGQSYMKFGIVIQPARLTY
ncbi:MAG TPA: hypothetical protein PLP19_10330 [bacterium]|nr:hypothetical protein [bacterium]HPN43875.1 hypothetical protein [bacterium]